MQFTNMLKLTRLGLRENKQTKRENKFRDYDWIRN